jgi:hypothetical protein
MLAAARTHFNLLCFIVATNHTALLAGLAMACGAIIVAIPIGASKGKLHVPGYVGLALVTFAIGLVFGRIAGSRPVTGTTLGVLLSILFFLLVATALGSILALLFYRPVPED